MGLPLVQKELDRLAAQIRRCTRCPLHESRTNAVPGEGKPAARVMLIGEAPGRDEDASGRPFVGAAGRFLDQVLAGTGLTRSDLFITNIVKCRPPKNRPPRKLEIDTCTSHYLFAQIERIDPRLIVLLGAVAAKTVLGIRRVTDVRGKIMEKDGRLYFLTYHPAVRFYREDLAEVVIKDFGTLKDEFEKLGLAKSVR
jgi:uracil-DNA glycosylase family 4